MGSEIQITFLGAFLAFIFVVSMGILLWWMFHVPRAIPLAAAKARRAVGAIKKILVPTSGTLYSERGIELACRLGEEQKAEIYLVNVIEVPRTLPLEAPMPEAETRAGEVIKRGEEIVTLRGLPVRGEVKRGRVAGEEIIRAAKDWEADLIVMGIRSEIRMAQEILGRSSDLVLRRAPCEVIVDKLSG
ncbi:MAG TPA: universal stress protein [Thermodesulfobacteriota bacterium]|jgi:nucleotide-binding universal stress UspA family protein|nr:universal stress protein [Thermodesulfobacteriota bacterium]